MSDSVKLTKKQKKLLAFKQNKGKKSARRDEVNAVPEEEPEEQEDVAGPSTPKSTTKRKRDDKEGEESEEPTTTKKRQRGGKKSDRTRLLVFVGNLSYDTTHQDVEDYFKKHTGEQAQIRFLTDKESGKPKGCAFVEFKTSNALQKALKLHRTNLKTRKINVELTAGGGGNSEQRKAKLEDLRQKLDKERAKRDENNRVKKEKEDAKKAAGDIAEGDTIKKKKVRDRRLQPEKKEKLVKYKASGANATPLGSQ